MSNADLPCFCCLVNQHISNSVQAANCNSGFTITLSIGSTHRRSPLKHSFFLLICSALKNSTTEFHRNTQKAVHLLTIAVLIAVWTKVLRSQLCSASLPGDLTFPTFISFRLQSLHYKTQKEPKPSVKDSEAIFQVSSNQNENSVNPKIICLLMSLKFTEVT